MKVDANKPYEVPEKYKAKKVGEPKMKKSSIFMVGLGTIIIYVAMAAVVIAIVWAICFGISKISKGFDDGISPIDHPDTEMEVNEA